MKFNAEISLGTVIQLFVFLVVVLGFVKKLGALETKLDMMYAWFEQQVINSYHNNIRVRTKTAGD